MTLKRLVTQNRSYRRFHQDMTVAQETLKQLIDLARLSPSARNHQPLKYFISNDSVDNRVIFNHLLSQRGRHSHSALSFHYLVFLI